MSKETPAADAAAFTPNELPVSDVKPVGEYDGGRYQGVTTNIDDLLGDLGDEPEVQDVEPEVPADEIVEDDAFDDEEVDDEEVDDEDDEDGIYDEDEEVDDDDLDDEPASKKPSPDEFLKYEVKAKINGEEVDVTVQELIDNYQLGQSAREKFSQAAQMRKQSEQFISLLKNPETVWNVIEQLGHNTEELAEQYIVERIKYHSMSDAEKRAMEAEKKYEQLSREQQRLQQEAQQRELAEQAKKYEGQLQAEITEALDSVGLVKNKRVFARVASIMADGLKNDMRLSATQAARIAKKQIQEEVSGFLAETDDETLSRFVGEKEKVKAGKVRGNKVKQRRKVDPRERGGTVVEKIREKKKLDPRDPNAYNELFKNL